MSELAALERVASELARDLEKRGFLSSETFRAEVKPILAAALAACAREREERLEAQIVISKLEAQIIEATWWNEEGLDLENYISPENAGKRLNFLRNTLKEVRALERAIGETE